MGRVYRARHALLRRPTAVKLLPAGLVTSNSGSGSSRRRRRPVCHPNTIAIYDFGTTPLGEFYYAMEYVDGPNLQQLVEWFGPMDPGRVIHITAAVAGALGEAQRRRTRAPRCEARERSDRQWAGHRIGERSRGGGVWSEQGSIADRHASIHGPGIHPVSASRCSVRHLLVSGESTMDICAKHLHDRPTSPSESHPVPNDLGALILTCLEKEPTERPASASELQRRLLECSATESWSEAAARAWWSHHGPVITSNVARARTQLSGTHDTLLDQSRRSRWCTHVTTGRRLRRHNDGERRPFGSSATVLKRRVTHE